MNCLDVCRQLASDPDHLDQKIQTHLQSCAQCTFYALEQKKFNQKLQLAANIDVPKALAERIMLRQSIEQQNQGKISKRSIVAVAAMLLVTVGLSASLLFTQSVSILESVVTTHIKNEKHHLSEFKSISQSQLNLMLSPLKLLVTTNPQKMTYAGTCHIRKHNGAHFVVRGMQGKVTILVMPGEFITTVKKINDRKYKGLIYPTSYGSMAVVGEVDENVEKIYQEFNRLVKIKS
ncbi:hypothetical protein MNBD_GAMMA12-3377 [hydrothermal vent metagenome]|uniref:Uncharacterized protein n=1 Tax=hydrothermal vent metagenome TaxID=652676 RepID=A0A3B0XYK2_9ZZZZ